MGTLEYGIQEVRNDVNRNCGIVANSCGSAMEADNRCYGLLVWVSFFSGKRHDNSHLFNGQNNFRGEPPLLEVFSCFDFKSALLQSVG